jgi:hypothetical protein
MTRRIYLSALAALVCAAAPELLRSRSPPLQRHEEEPLLKLAEPWPKTTSSRRGRRKRLNASSLRNGARRVHAETEFSLLNKERTPNNSKRFPAVMTVDRQGHPGEDRLARPSAAQSADLRVRAHQGSNSKRRTSRARSSRAGQPEARHALSERKGGRSVRNPRVHDLQTREPSSRRSRSARAWRTAPTSTPSRTRRSPTHNALFLEHDNDVSHRLNGRDVSLPRIEFKDLDKESTNTMFLLEYMLGNTDYSIYALHNVVIVQDKKRTLFPVAYDFDMSGMVHPPYAIPDPRLHLRAVTDRLYRGPCRTVDEMNTARRAVPVQEGRHDLRRSISMKELNGSHKGEMKDYIESFFKTIDKPESIKKTFVDGHKVRRRCRRALARRVGRVGQVSQ